MTSVDAPRAEMPALGRRYNAAETFVDAHLGVRDRRTALRYQGQSITFGQLSERVNRTGNALSALGVGMEQRVMLLCADSPAFVEGFFGAIKLGAIPVPTNPLLTSADVAYILEDSRAVAAVVSAPFLPKLLEVRSHLPHLRHILVAESEGDPAAGIVSLEAAQAAAEPELSPADTTPDDAGFWLYSSGTTGFPKGVVHRQQDMLYCCETYAQSILRTTEADLLFTVSPLFHAYGLGNGVFFPLRVGATSLLKPERPTPDLVYGLITRERPTILFTSPTFYAALLAYPDQDFPYDLSSLRLCVSAGESLPKPIFDSWRQRFGLDILDGIGSTEMLHIFISNAPGGARGGTSGTVVPGYRAKIVDDDERELGRGETGSLWVSGDSALAFYWNQSRRTRATIRGEWIVTGDRYHLDADGYFTYEGRSDDMLKVSGQWVSPAEVEATLMADSRVLECAVVGARDRDDLVKPKAFVLLKSGVEPSNMLAAELQAFVKGRIMPHKYPRWIEFVQDLPKTATGKIQRFRLRDSP